MNEKRRKAVEKEIKELKMRHDKIAGQIVKMNNLAMSFDSALGRQEKSSLLKSLENMEEALVNLKATISSFE